MKHKVFLTNLVLLSCLSLSLSGQDLNFSQYFSSPLLVNPAATGFIYGDQRISVHIRQQNWGGGTPFFTAAASYDTKITTKKASAWAIGINAFEDKAAEGLYKSNALSLSGAYHAKLDVNLRHSLGVGFAVSYNNKAINFSDGRFADQFTVDGFDPGIASGETKLTVSSTSVDLSTGILYTYDDSRTSAFLGIGGFHLNRHSGTSRLLLLGTNERRFTVNGGMSFKTVNGRVFLSSIYQTMNSASSFAVGGAYKFEIASEDKQLAFYLGGFIGNATSYPYTAVQFNNLQVGISYDILSGKVNPYRRVTNNIELSLMYIIPEKRNAAKSNTGQ